MLFDPTAHLCIMPSFSITPQSSYWQSAKVVCGFLFISCHIHGSAFLLCPGAHATLTFPLQLVYQQEHLLQSRLHTLHMIRGRGLIEFG